MLCLYNDDTGLADTASVHIFVGTSSICTGMLATESANPKTMQPLASYMPDKTKLLEDYYGTPLAMLAGIEFMRNAEHRPFLAD